MCPVASGSGIVCRCPVSISSLCLVRREWEDSLARPLAAQLRLPFLGKDVIKEALMSVFGVETIDESRRIGGAAIATLFALARANRRALLESNWTDRLSTGDLLGLGGVIVEVFCDVDPAVSRQRYLDRAATRHRGHFDQDRHDDLSLWEGVALQPIAGGWPVLRVDTCAPGDIDALVRDLDTAAEHA